MNKLRWMLIIPIVILLISVWNNAIRAQTIPTTNTITTTTLAFGSTTPLIFPIPTHSPALTTFIDQENCLHSFVEFAYFGTMNLTARTTLPPAPWQHEATIPYDPNEYHLRGYSDFVIELARQKDGENEIWIRGWHQDAPVWFIYQPETGTWDQVSRQIDGDVLFGSELFVSPDGTLWSNVEWNQWSREIPEPETFPALSRFNETTRRFEIPKSVMVIPVAEEKLYGGYDFGPLPKIVLDKQGMFWIFVQHDGIYQYNPIAETNEKRAEYSEFPVVFVALAPDGSIYFSNPAGVSRSAVVEGMIFQFIPETDEIIALNIPDEPWPIFREMLFDRSGRLWLGSTGYRDISGNWHLIIPNPEEAFDHVGEYWWSRPFLLTESSDGRLWYIRFNDGKGDGTAWYDPETGKGCLVTDYPSNVAEDSNQQLWMIADGTLYKYLLNP